MTEYTAGDLVEAVKGESLVRGRLVESLGILGLGADGGTIHWYEYRGYTITVIEKATPVVVLPTEPGLYQDCEGDPWRLGRLGWKLLTSDPPDAFKPEEHVPFTRLAPVSETAKKVLDRVAKVWPWSTSTTMLNRVAIDFGVEL